MAKEKLGLGLGILLTVFVSAAVTYDLGKNQEHLQQKFLPASDQAASLSMPPPTPSPSPDPTQNLDESYHLTLATFFWVGEPADESNGYIDNVKSAWDSSWMTHFGGLDDPEDRCGYHPCSFTPLENPFYFALPYNDLDAAGLRKDSARQIPWFKTAQDQKSVLKNTWIEVRYFDQTCYAQWQDVGPFETDDFDYVFGEEPPQNQLGVKAGLDLSPAMRDCLKMTTNDRVGWKFVEGEEVPAGPWTEIITTRSVSW